MSRRGELVALEALTWVGTPFHEQQAVKGAGCDCKGLIWGVARELGFPEADSVHACFTAYDVAKRGGIPVARLVEGLADLFDRVPRGSPLELGDLLLLRAGIPAVAQHLAIVATSSSAVHASGNSNSGKESKRIVRETSLRALLDYFPLASAWRWREELV